MEVGYGLLSVAQYVSCKVVLYFSCLHGSWMCYGDFRPNTNLLHGSGTQFYLLLSPYLCFISLLYLDLYVLGDDTLIS